MMNRLMDVTQDNLKSLLETSLTQPVVIYFYSEAQPEAAAFKATLATLAQKKADLMVFATLNCDADPQLAAQFGLRQLPSFYLLSGGRPVDALEGEQTEASLETWITPYLPNEYELDRRRGEQLLADQQPSAAIAPLKKAWEGLRNAQGHPRGDVAVLLADALIQEKRIAEAKEVLATVLLQDQDSHYQRLMAAIEISEQAAHSPELQALEQAFQADPQQSEKRIQFAMQLMHVGRSEEALALLFEPLKTDLNAGEGSIKKALLESLTALGTSHPLANQYRRQLYTLLY